ncbi:hypothetical protein [Paenibacillus sp. FSL H3-0469]|uniref:hypothetical protein n=1 Tax=Paenibacillus sp. FSL H3-0469 TaxID=2954506 RepID=UPI00310108C1
MADNAEVAGVLRPEAQRRFGHRCCGVSVDRSCGVSGTGAAAFRAPELRRFGHRSCGVSGTGAAAFRAPELRRFGDRSCGDSGTGAAAIRGPELRRFGGPERTTGS